MTSTVTYFDSKVNNTETYGTHVNIEIGLKLEDEQVVQYVLTVTKEGCTIRKMKGQEDEEKVL